jgi:hypothetical protein
MRVRVRYNGLGRGEQMSSLCLFSVAFVNSPFILPALDGSRIIGHHQL